MKAALAGVRADAAMMRSPSFSREGESRTMTNSSFAVKVGGQYGGGGAEEEEGAPKAFMTSGIESKTACAGEWSTSSPFLPLARSRAGTAATSMAAGMAECAAGGGGAGVACGLGQACFFFLHRVVGLGAVSTKSKRRCWTRGAFQCLEVCCVLLSSSAC